MVEEVEQAVARVKAALSASGTALEVVQLSASTKTAQAAADTIGCAVAQIAKSLIFEDKETGELILVVASGTNKVHQRRLGRQMERKLRMADAERVLRDTGFAVGGVAPVGHLQPLPIYIDEDLFQYEALWAAAGSHTTVFKLTPNDLKTMTHGTVVCVT